MKVILLKKINKLNNLGKIIKIKNGYARNYLIPNNIVKLINIKNYPIKKEIFINILNKNLILKFYKKVFKKIYLFKYLNKIDILNLFKKKKIYFKKKQINLKGSIKFIGNYIIKINLNIVKYINIIISIFDNKD